MLSASQVTTRSSVVNIETTPAGTYKFHCDTDAPSNWALKFRNASNTDVYVVESAGSMGPNAAITVILTEDVVKVSPWWQGTNSGLKKYVFMPRNRLDNTIKLQWKILKKQKIVRFVNTIPKMALYAKLLLIALYGDMLMKR